MTPPLARALPVRPATLSTLAALGWLRYVRWAIAGGSSLLLQLAIQALLITLVGLPARPGIVLAYELALVMHFFVNDRWVFHKEGPGRWRRLAAFHASAIAAEVVTLTVAMSVLSAPVIAVVGEAIAPSIATIAGVAAATVLTFTASFFWIWKASPEVGSAARRPASVVAAGT